MTTPNLNDICVAMGVPGDVRDCVEAFSRLMEQKLAEMDGRKGGWDECDLQWLLAKLMEEVGELAEIIVKMHWSTGKRFHQSDSRTENFLVLEGIREAVDVGNVAMMLADTLAHQYRQDNKGS